MQSPVKLTSDVKNKSNKNNQTNKSQESTTKTSNKRLKRQKPQEDNLTKKKKTETLTGSYTELNLKFWSLLEQHWKPHFHIDHKADHER